MSMMTLWWIAALIIAPLTIWAILRQWRWNRTDYAQALLWRQEDLDRWRDQQEERLAAAWVKVRDRANELEHFRIELARRESAVRDAESDFNIRRLDSTPPVIQPPSFGTFAPGSQPLTQHPYFASGEEPTSPPWMRHLTQPPSGAVPPLGPNARPDDGMGEADSELNEAFGYTTPQYGQPGRVTRPIRPFETQESRELMLGSIQQYLRAHNSRPLQPEQHDEGEQPA